MKDISQKIKDCLIIYTSDGSFTWSLRFFILVVAILTAYFSTPYISEIVISYIGNHLTETGDTVPGNKTTGNKIFESSVTIFVFVLIFGIGQWIIKTHDTKKQFSDNFNQRNETLYSNAIDLVTQKDKAKIVIGLMELTDLYNNNFIDHDRITRTIARLPFAGMDLNNEDLSGVNLSGANFRNATLKEVDFEGANLERISFEGATLLDINFQDAKLSNANLNEACLIKGKGKLNGALLKHARLTNLYLIKTNLNGADLSDTDLRTINVPDANIDSTVIEEKARRSDAKDMHKQPLWSLSPPEIKAILKGAKYNADTKFRDGINPEDYGMIRKS